MRYTFMSDGYAAVKNDVCYEDQNEDYCGDAIDKLAAYEDTGYSPLEIKSLEGEWNAMRKVVDSYRKAEEQGRLIDADALIKRLEKQRVVVLSYLPEAHAREEGMTQEDYIFERNGDMISMLRNQAAVIPAEEGE